MRARIHYLGAARRRQAGFTLTELMIVMGLSGLVAAALLSIAQVHARNEQQAQQGHAVDVLDQALVADDRWRRRQEGGGRGHGITSSA